MKLLAVIAASAAFVLSAHAAAPRSARVTVTDVLPFTVHGSQFLAQERVTVVVTTKGRNVHTLTASAAGSFTTRFMHVKLGTCAAYAVTVTGNRGSRAFVKVVPECAQPPAEPQALFPTGATPKTVGARRDVASPTLRLLAMRPMRVSGANFEPRERVTVRLFLDDQIRAHRVTASRGGTLVVTFRDVLIDECTSFSVTARGDGGSRATLKSRDLAECPQPVPSG